MGMMLWTHCWGDAFNTKQEEEAACTRPLFQLTPRKWGSFAGDGEWVLSSWPRLHRSGIMCLLSCLVRSRSLTYRSVLEGKHFHSEQNLCLQQRALPWCWPHINKTIVWRMQREVAWSIICKKLPWVALNTSFCKLLSIKEAYAPHHSRSRK